MSESQIHVSLPGRSIAGKTVLTADWCNSVREAVGRLSSRGGNQSRDGTETVYPPLTVALKIHAGDPPTYGVFVSPGQFWERNKCLGVDVDAMIPWPLDSYILDVDGFPVEFPIALNKAIFIHATENAYGAISAVEVVVAAKDAKTLNFIPTVQAGEHYYKLAALESVDGQTALVNYLAGSHIIHVSGLTCDVRVMTCDPDNDGETTGDGYSPAQLLRLSIVGGTIVSVGESVAARPLAATVEECTVVHCT